MIIDESIYSQIVSSIQNHMLQKGLECKSELFLDGVIHRYSATSHKDKAEWYIGMCIEDNHYICLYGSWRTGEKFIYKSYADGIIKHEELKIQIARDEIALEEAKDRETKKKEVAIIWKNSFPVYKHPYLEKKKVKGETLKHYGSYLIVPYYDIDKTLTTLQKIDYGGSKRFMSGVSVSGLFHPIGDYENSDVIIFCEGYATAASCNLLTKVPTICCGSANNVVLVGRTFAMKYPGKKLILGADNDDAGMKTILQWKEYVSLFVAFPKETGKDFNDIISVADEETKIRIKELFFPPSISSINLESFLNKTLEEEIWFNDIIKKGSFNIIYGSAGVGKSRVACELGFCLALKESFLSYQTVNKAKVLYVDGEMTETELQLRLKDLCKRYEDIDVEPDSFHVLSSQSFYKETGQDIDLFNEEHRARLTQAFQDRDIIILDNYGCLINLPEGDNYKIDIRAWKKFFTWVKKFKEEGKTIILVMHVNKSGSLQGIGQIRNDADLVVEIKKAIDVDKEALLHFNLFIDKGRSISENKKLPINAKLFEKGYDNRHKWSFN